MDVDMGNMGKNFKRKYLVATVAAFWALGLFGLIIFLGGCTPQEKSPKTLSFNTKVKSPSFTIKVLGKGNQSFSDFKKPLVLHFWAPYCPPCKKEMLEIQDWYEEGGDKPSLLAVSVMDSQQSVENFVRKKGISFPVGLDEDGKIMRRFQLSGALPATVFINSERRIVSVHPGPLTKKKLKSEIKKVFREGDQ